MSATSQILSMGQQFSGLPMGALIGGPLEAAAKANQQMAMTQLQFMMNTCFIPRNDANGKATGQYDPITIEFILESNIIEPGNPTASPPVSASVIPYTTSFKLPILTIIPLNALAVDDVAISFEMEVKSSFAQDNSTDTSSKTSEKVKFSAEGQIGPFHVGISGSVSHDSSSENKSDTHYKQSNSAKYEVKVHAGQLPLPLGVKTIIDAYAKNISLLYQLQHDRSWQQPKSSNALNNLQG